MNLSKFVLSYKHLYYSLRYNYKVSSSNTKRIVIKYNNINYNRDNSIIIIMLFIKKEVLREGK